jgi:hypothetical protein
MKNSDWFLILELVAFFGVLVGGAIFAGCCLASLCANAAEPEAAAATNVFISSETVELPGWYRRIVYSEGGEPKNDEGVIVSAADAAAQETVIEYAGEISQAAKESLDEAVGGLLSVTNLVPSNATHIALSLGRLSPSKNLAGEVVAEWTDGSNDWQAVEYNQRLGLPPGRKIRYSFVDQTNDVEFVWDEPWDRESLVHTGRVVRPAAFRSIRALSWRHERFGGANGFDFGSAVVGVNTPDGVRYALTTNVTVEVGGVVAELQFRNGARVAVKKQNEGVE